MKHLYLILAALSVTIQICQGQIQNPKTRWKFQTQGTIRGGAVADQTRLYFGSSDATLYCVNKADGQLAWKFQTQGAIVSSPCLTSGLVIVQSRDNNVYALNSASGELTWKFQMQNLLPFEWGWDYFSAAPIATPKSVLVASGVIIGSSDNKLYSLE